MLPYPASPGTDGYERYFCLDIRTLNDHRASAYNFAAHCIDYHYICTHGNSVAMAAANSHEQHKCKVQFADLLPKLALYLTPSLLAVASIDQQAV